MGLPVLLVMKDTRLPSLVHDLLKQNLPRQSVQLAVGELILDEAQLRNDWRELTKDTSLAGTKLNLRIIPAEQQCMWCFLVYRPNDREATCPQCGSVGARVLSGEEFHLEGD